MASLGSPIVPPTSLDSSQINRHGTCALIACPWPSAMLSSAVQCKRFSASVRVIITQKAPILHCLTHCVGRHLAARPMLVQIRRLTAHVAICSVCALQRVSPAFRRSLRACPQRRHLTRRTTRHSVEFMSPTALQRPVTSSGISYFLFPWLSVFQRMATARKCLQGVCGQNSSQPWRSSQCSPPNTRDGIDFCARL